jgi:hypothetical protein
MAASKMKAAYENIGENGIEESGGVMAENGGVSKAKENNGWHAAAKAWRNESERKMAKRRNESNESWRRKLSNENVKKAYQWLEKIEVKKKINGNGGNHQRRRKWRGG